MIEMIGAAGDRTSDPIELINSINRGHVFREGKDIFICPGKEIGVCNQGILLNPGEQTEHWRVNKARLLK